MKNRETNDSGVVLIVVLLLMMVITIMMLGFYFETTGEQQVAASDRDNAVTYYAAQGGLENMSSALAALFTSTVSPSVTQITDRAGATYQAGIPVYNNVGTLTSSGVNFEVYSITNQATPATTNPTTAACTPGPSVLCSTPGIIPGTGPLSGLEGILTPFLLTVVAAGPNNTEVKMTRQIQEVAVPVFEYGIFSQTDLSFFAGSSFTFGGRTATNGNLYLSEGGATLTLNDKVTAFGSVIRSQLSNGLSTATNYATPVEVTIGTAGGCPTPTCPTCTPTNATNSCRALALTEGSVTGGPGSAANPNWQTLSMTTYGGYIRSGSTGVKQMNLTLVLAGVPPIDMIDRPPAGELLTSVVAQERFFNQASVRILLSDTPSQITSLPGVTATAPYPLAEGTAAASGMSNIIQRTNSASSYYLPPTDSCHPPIAESPGWASDNDYMMKSGTTLLGGYIKIEVQLNSAPGTWQDVTKEVLSLGISRDVQSSGTLSPLGCTNISILHLEEARPFTPEGAPTLAAGGGGGSLTNGTTYYYVVTPVISAGVVPGTEASFKATSTNKIALTWSAYPGATAYYVYRGTSAGGETGYINAGAVTAYTDSGSALTASTPPTTILSSTTATAAPTNFVPINIYDPREGEVRDSNNFTTASMNGVMNLMEVDVGNLQSWLANRLCTASTVPTSCPSGALAWNNSGYILYVSDRRGNCNQTAAATAGGPCTANDTGQYGYDDIVNPLSGTGAPNNVLDTGEDVDANGVLDTYGGIAHTINAANIDTSGGAMFPTGSATTLAAFLASLTNPAIPDAAPLSRITSAGTGPGFYEAQKNSVLFFRRAVRLVDGTLGNLPPYAAANLATCPNAATPATNPSGGGFTVAAENPVYIWGDYNASHTVGAFSPDPSATCHVPAAVFADAVTLLSNDWVDSETFANPTSVASRPAVVDPTFYRVAVIGGKNISFPLPTYTVPAAPNEDFGTDGGAHNFLRYIENWNGTALNYFGSMVSFYYSQQGTGIYKYPNTVYLPPSRNYAFDSDFNSVVSLPPGTPRFTNVNILSYQQETLSTQ